MQPLSFSRWNENNFENDDVLRHHSEILVLNEGRDETEFSAPRDKGLLSRLSSHLRKEICHTNMIQMRAHVLVQVSEISVAMVQMDCRDVESLVHFLSFVK